MPKVQASLLFKMSNKSKSEYDILFFPNQTQCGSVLRAWKFKKHIADVEIKTKYGAIMEKY